MAKTKNISLRFDEDDLKLALEKSGLIKNQKLFDLLLSEYVRPYKIKKHPFFISSTMADDAPNTHFEWGKLQTEYPKLPIKTTVKIGGYEIPIKEVPGMEGFALVKPGSIQIDLNDIEKQIAAIHSEVKPSIIPKANWERSKQKRISALQNQLK